MQLEKERQKMKANKIKSISAICQLSKKRPIYRFDFNADLNPL